MQYLLRDIKVFEGSNKRGKYYWLQATLFNDKNIRMNSERRIYVTTSDDEAKLYLPYGKKNDAESSEKTTVYDVNDADLRAAMADSTTEVGSLGVDVRHVNAVKVTWPLSGVWGRIYRNDVINPTTGEITGHKGDWVKNAQGGIDEYKEISFYLATDIDPDTNERIYGDNPQLVANRILERSYKLLTADTAPTVATATPPAEPAAETDEEKAARIAELKRQLEEAGA